ncbi:MAG: Secretion protein HlyD [Burkholderiaceae bacterium]|nr:Secretion protein HlyD [Burkholderiaceae bacterium]
MTQENADNAREALQAMLEKVPQGMLAGGKRRRYLMMSGAAILALVVLFFIFPGGKSGEGQYVTEEAVAGNLVVTVSASGTLQPTKSVDVGSELSGTLAKVLVEENDQVKKGQLLAQLDLDKLKDAVTKSRAALAAARATVAQAQATLAESKASLARMRHVAELSGGKVPSKTELETAEASLKRAIANEASARASVAQADATLKTDETNLAKGTIRSPVDGVVLTRKVEPGQTVAAAMTTPVLFTIAEDLTKMELQVKVDEADVGTVKLGQPSTFTVAAWPGRNFPATIQRVGIGSTITDNVVTYKTVLTVGNDDLALRPGMTATASIVTANRENVLLVPNSALRFTPPAKTAAQKGSFVSGLLPRPPAGPAQKVVTQAAGADSQQQVWVLEQGKPKAVSVQAGVSNGKTTEITGGELKAGMQVITDYQEAKK